MNNALSDKKASCKAEVRREQILDAASECFKKSGFHGASMAEIAKSFGMSAGHIYNYFDSKEDIIEAMVKRDLSDTLARIEVLQQEDNLLQGILNRVSEGIERRFVNKGIDAEILAEACRNPKVASTVQETDSMIRASLNAVLSRVVGKTTKEDTLSTKTTLLLAMFDGLMIRAIRDPNLNKADLEEALTQLIENLLQPNNARASLT